MSLPFIAEKSTMLRSVRAVVAFVIMGYNVFCLPCVSERKRIISDMNSDLKSFVYETKIRGQCGTMFKPVVCAICDGIPKEANWWQWMSTAELHNHCKHIPGMKKKTLKKFYPAPLLDCYSSRENHALEELVISPETVFSDIGDAVIICNSCARIFRSESENKTKKSIRLPPKDAIANGYLIGEPPKILRELNDIELALVSNVRIHAHVFNYFGGQHKCISGWHTLFRNPCANHAIDLNTLMSGGMDGHIYVVLSGPFTPNQVAVTKAATAVDPKKVISALSWLVENNYHYKDVKIPLEENVPLPILLEQQALEQSMDIGIENKVNMAVIFPDKDLPEPTNGGFKTQEDFRKFVSKHQSGHWDSKFIANHGEQRLVDYKGDAIAQAFPLLFPYGHSGLEEDAAVKMMSQRRGYRKQMGRKRLDVFRKYLQHRKQGFHSAMFNLITENMILRETVYQSVVMKCNTKRSETQRMGELFGSFTSKDLLGAISDARSRNPRQWSARGANQYLRSIHAACQQLPHSNEAVEENRKVYFSYLMRFGMPALMLTVTPDDERSLRVIVYAVRKDDASSLLDGSVDVSKLDDSQIILEHKICTEARAKHPGLCAEEYSRVIALVIKHIFGWDEATQCSIKPGLFGEVLAWCLATEEQGRKTLHGHFLVWLKNWDTVMEALQCHGNSDLTAREALHEVTTLHDACCSSRLFEDMRPGRGVLSGYPVFSHRCGDLQTRNWKNRKVTPTEVGHQQLREMRHRRLWEEHNGHIATCGLCEHKFTMNDIVSTALRVHSGCDSESFRFPDRSHRLFRFMIEQQKCTEWHDFDEAEQARRYFLSNAMNNVHLTTHTNRCFKKGCECFASLPDSLRFETMIEFAKVPDYWYDWEGNVTPRYMFRFYPARGIEDAYINIHNPELTQILHCNTNVLFGLNGRCVYYCTCYNCKSQQKEEKESFTKVSEAMVKHIQKQEEAENDGMTVPSQDGFRRLLAGIFIHTKSHIIAAPMAHYMALHGSRFRFSHDNCTMSTYGAENYLMEEPVLMSLKKGKDGKLVPFHACMHYLYRSDKLEDMSFYEFIRQIKVLPISICKAQNISETFSFSDNHPQSETHTCVYRERPAIPTFAWAWLPGTGDFEEPIMANTDATKADYLHKEKYARRFMMLFTPFRNHDELKISGSYTRRLQFLHQMKRIASASIHVANNIQNIRNSLNSTMMQNVFPTETELPVDDDDYERVMDDEDLPDFDIEAILQQTGEIMTPPDMQKPITEEATSFSPSCADADEEQEYTNDDHVDSFRNLEDAFENPIGNPSSSPPLSESPPNARQFAHMRKFNTLVLSRFIERNSAYDPAGESPGNREFNVDAIGTWQSVVAWGKNAKLDPEQQIAFEILAATFVLGFLDEAEGVSEMSDTTATNKAGLEALARRGILYKNEPLCAYITGPAGAGKCKSTVIQWTLRTIVCATHHLV